MIGRLTTIRNLNESLRDGIVIFSEQIKDAESGKAELKNTFLTSNASIVRAVYGEIPDSFNGFTDEAFDIVKRTTQKVVPELFCGYVHTAASILEPERLPIDGELLNFDENRFCYVFPDGGLLTATFVEERAGSYVFQYYFLEESYSVSVDKYGVPVGLNEDHTEIEDYSTDDYLELKRYVIANSKKVLSPKDGYFVILKNMESFYISVEKFQNLPADSIVLKFECVGYFEVSGQLRAVKLSV